MNSGYIWTKLTASTREVSIRRSLTVTGTTSYRMCGDTPMSCKGFDNIMITESFELLYRPGKSTCKVHVCVYGPWTCTCTCLHQLPSCD